MSENLLPLVASDVDDTWYDGLSIYDYVAAQIDDGSLPAHALQMLEVTDLTVEGYRQAEDKHESVTRKLLTGYAKVLEGVPFMDIKNSTEAYIKKTDKFYGFTEPVVDMMAATHDLAFITGEPQFVVDAVGNRFGTSKCYGSQFEVVDGLFSGRLLRSLATSNERLQVIASLLKVRPETEVSVGFGDSNIDIKWLSAMSHAICINPAAELRATAQAENKSSTNWYIIDEPSLAIDAITGILVQVQAGRV